MLWGLACWSHWVCRWDGEKEIEDQFSNYQQLMDFMNSEPQMKIKVLSVSQWKDCTFLHWSHIRCSLAHCWTISRQFRGALGSLLTQQKVTGPSLSWRGTSSHTVTVTTTTGAATTPHDHSTSTWTGSWRPGSGEPAPSLSAPGDSLPAGWLRSCSHCVWPGTFRTTPLSLTS